MSNSVQKVRISSNEDAGQRLDNFLMRHLKGVPRSHIYKILRSGEVRINGSRAKPTYRVSVGDEIRIPPVRTRQAAPVVVTEDLADTLNRSVIYESTDYLVINKPRGVAVHGGSSIRTGVIEAMREITNNPRLALVHRIDRETSGCLALAKRPQALKLAQAAFRQRTTRKIYQAIVWGSWPKKLRVVQTRLKRTETDWGERRVKADESGQPARTDFEIVLTCTRATWLRASLHTGRTHQIRVHAQTQGHPLVGDEKYTGPELRHPVIELTEALSAPLRMCLHAARLVIPLPDEDIRVEAPVPEDMQTQWQVLCR